MKKHFCYLGIWSAVLLLPCIASAQDFIKTDLGITFLEGKKFIQSFDFNLNRTDEVQNTSGGHYFLYSNKRVYIIPTVDANLGESVTAAGNNIVTQVSFGKRFKDYDVLRGLTRHFFKVGLEFSPTYNADKSFLEKLYYAQFKVYLNPVFSHSSSPAPGSYANWIFSFAINPIFNLGSHDSQTYQVNQTYSAGGLNTAVILRLNKQDTSPRHSLYEDWVFKVNGNGYRLFSEISALYAKDYYGQFSTSVDKSIKPGKISANITYKYGNENAKYTTVNALTFGFKYKF